jgi:nucleotide-binding universal stress UspA family protein
MPETIVLGYDDSPSANAALAETARLATQLGASVVVVFGFHVSALGGPITGGESSDFRARLEQVGQRALARAISDLEAAGVEVAARLVEAKPADAILQVADEVGASLVVVGTRGENPITGAVLGSVVLRLVQHSTLPLLVVPASE